MADQTPVEFTVRCRMANRWVPHFLSMLDYMQTLGAVGSSRTVSIYADGDGDFRPRFIYPDGLLPEPVSPKTDNGGDVLYDAG